MYGCTCVCRKKCNKIKLTGFKVNYLIHNLVYVLGM